MFIIITIVRFLVLFQADLEVGQTTAEECRGEQNSKRSAEESKTVIIL